MHLSGIVDNFYFEINPFRIVAPVAGEWAAFEKDGGSDVWAIMEGISLNCKNC